MAVIKEKLFARRDEVTDFAIGARQLALPEELNQWIHRNTSLALQPASPMDKAAFDKAAVSFLVDEYGIGPDDIGIIATTVEALNRGFRIVMARDCCAGDPSSYADDIYRNTLNNLAYLSNSEDIASVWRSA